ncbi:hypothetical protein Tco_0616590 [Tanacetum coccineum]
MNERELKSRSNKTQRTNPKTSNQSLWFQSKQACKKPRYGRSSRRDNTHNNRALASTLQMKGSRSEEVRDLDGSHVSPERKGFRCFYVRRFDESGKDLVYIMHEKRYEGLGRYDIISAPCWVPLPSERAGLNGGRPSKGSGQRFQRGSGKRLSLNGIFGAPNKMKVAYKPSEFFCLRDLHHAVNNLPADAFVPEFSNDVAVSCCDVHLSSVLSDKVLYSWGDNEDVGRKVIVISSCLLEDIDSATKDNINADKCVSVDFVLLEKVSSGRGALSESLSCRSYCVHARCCCLIGYGRL